MATAKKAAPKAKAKSVKKEAQSEVAANDINIGVSVTMLDGSVHLKELAIVNPGGCILKSQINNSDRVFEMVKQGLVHMYGANHIRG